MDSPERLDSGKMYEFFFLMIVSDMPKKRVLLTSGDYQVNRPGHLRVDEGGFWPILIHGDETSTRPRDGTNGA